MVIRVVYLFMVRVFGWLVLLARNDAAKDAESLALATATHCHAAGCGWLVTLPGRLNVDRRSYAAPRGRPQPLRAHSGLREVSVLSALARNRRVRIVTTGYLIVAVFGVVAMVACWGFGVSGTGALVAGVVAAAPIVIAMAGDRITGIKAFSVEISLAQIMARDDVDLTQAVMAIAEMGPSGSPSLLATLRDTISARARLLSLNLRNDDYWWSTRVYLVAALAMDYTNVEQLLFVRGQEERIWIGMIDPPMARDLLAQVFPEYERYYREVRNLTAPADVSAPPDSSAEIETILANWPGKFGWNEAQAKQIVTSDLVRQWLGAKLDTGALRLGRSLNCSDIR